MEPLRHLHLPAQIRNAGSRNFSNNETALGQNGKRKARAAPNAFRVVVRVISLAVAASIIGVLAHASVVWFTTRNVVQQQPNGVRQRAWPNHIDVWPTWVMLGAAVIAVVVQILSLLTFCGGVSSRPFAFHGVREDLVKLTTIMLQVRRLRETHLHNWAVFFTSLVGIAAWIAAAAYFKWQDSQGKKSWDLWSWSCTHKSLKNGKMSFESMCVEMVCRVSPLDTSLPD